MSSPPLKHLLPIQWVSQETICEAFNKGQFWQRTQSGQLIPHITRDKHPEQPPYEEPFCTRKQFIVYHTPHGEPVAWVHQFLRPDKTLGLSGKPDPKCLVVSGQMLKVRARPKQ